MPKPLTPIAQHCYKLLEQLDMLQTPVLLEPSSIITRIQKELRLPVQYLPDEIEEQWMTDFLTRYQAGDFDTYLAGREQRWAFYRSEEWAEMKALAYSIFGNRCMCCGNLGGLSVDHIRSRHDRPDLELDIRNLQILCIDCNKGKSGARTDYRTDDDLRQLWQYLNR